LLCIGAIGAVDGNSRAYGYKAKYGISQDRIAAGSKLVVNIGKLFVNYKKIT
jgi:hypothetical protein